MGSFITKILCCFSRLNRAELEQTDRRTRTLMLMHWTLNPICDVARVYLSRKEAGEDL